MVKLLHAADLHLDSAFSALPPEKAAQRRAEQRLVLERLTALSEGCEAMQAEQSREPTLEEVAQRLELPLETVNTAMDAISVHVSLYEPVYTDGGDPLTVMDQVRDTKNTDEQWVERIALREAISTLGEREKRILALRFFDGRTQMEVASEVGISQAQVSRLEKNAIRTLRKAIC